AENSIQFAILLGQEGGATQAVAMLATDRAADGKERLVEVASHALQGLHVVGIARIQKGTQVELAMARMGKERSRYVMALEHILDLHEKARQCLGRHRHVLDAGESTG